MLLVFFVTLFLSFTGLARALLAAHNQAAHHAQLARQVTSDSCITANTRLRQCAGVPATRVECMCKPALEFAIYQCLLDRGEAASTTDYADGQQQLDALVETCQQAQIDMPVYTLPGQDPKRQVGTINSPIVTKTAPPAPGDGDNSVSTSASASTPVSQSTPAPATTPPPITPETAPAAANAPTSTASTFTGDLDLNDFDGSANIARVPALLLAGVGALVALVLI